MFIDNLGIGVIMMNEQKHYTLYELEGLQDWEEAVIVFKPESFTNEYSEIERSYKIWHNDNWFDGQKISFSLWGNCLDGKDNAVRLDWYIKDTEHPWVVDYCYIIK